MDQNIIKIVVALGCFLLAAILEYLILPQILYIAYKKHLYDIPNARKIHHTPTPRLGGISFMPVILLVLGTGAVARLMVVTDTVLSPNVTDQTIIYILIAMGLMMLYLVGAVDDLVGIGYRHKFIVQIFASILPPIGGLWINDFGGLFGIGAIPAFIGIPFTILLFVYTINAINLIDGIDGLSSGLSCLALMLIAFECFKVGHFSMGLLAITFLGILCVFFKFNVFNKGLHKLFMGDAGSMSLGYVLCILLVHFWNRRPDWNPFEHNLNIVVTSALLIPLMDVIHVVIMRIVHHCNPFLPDKTHIHHRLINAGFSSHQTFAILLCCSAFIILLNLALASQVSALALFLTDIICWLIINTVVHFLTIRRNKVVTKS
jgi:UDP-GlcNAc:undecaprenyl-phosphate GlcNAc-1-phosphate transferase